MPHVGAEREQATARGASHDLHPEPLLQLHGGYRIGRYVPTPATRMEPKTSLSMVLDWFHALPLLSFPWEKQQKTSRLLILKQEVSIMESALIFPATLLTLRMGLRLS